ncbi:hypothetical protein B0H14DRAFT_3448589 [Mycena olivaceomarginata]|nr:hypothetical protein B0H14DRAFT_3448589 [Mycena olivaceomarginata]
MNQGSENSTGAPNVWSPSVPMKGNLLGAVRSRGEFCMVHHGDPTFIRHIPTKKEAPPLQPHDLMGNFWSPSFVSPQTLYAMFIPKGEPWNGPLLGRLRCTFSTLQILEYPEGGLGFAPLRY